MNKSVLIGGALSLLMGLLPEVSAQSVNLGCYLRDGIGASPIGTCRVRQRADASEVQVIDSVDNPLADIHAVPSELFPDEGHVDISIWNLNTDRSRNFTDAPMRLRQHLSLSGETLTRQVFDLAEYGSDDGVIAEWDSTLSFTEEGLEIDTNKLAANYDSTDPAYTNNRVTIQIRSDGRLAIRYSRRSAETGKYEETARYVYNREPQMFVATEDEPPLQMPTAPNSMRIVSTMTPIPVRPPASVAIMNARNTTGYTYGLQRHTRR